MSAEVGRAILCSLQDTFLPSAYMQDIKGSICNTLTECHDACLTERGLTFLCRASRSSLARVAAAACGLAADGSRRGEALLQQWTRTAFERSSSPALKACVLRLKRALATLASKLLRPCAA